MAALLGLVADPAPAGGCRLALVLALDVSQSVDVLEDRLQREGLSQALLAPEVVRAFFTGDPVALYVFEWSDMFTQSAILPDWQLVRSEADLVHIARAIAASTRTDDNNPTALGAALRYAAAALARAPGCRAHTIDVAGDGWSNNWHHPRVVYRTTPQLDGVTVNALIVDSPDKGGPIETSQELVAYFEAEVLRGPGAFWLLADGYEDYARAMQAKLLRELQLPLVSEALLSNGDGRSDRERNHGG